MRTHRAVFSPKNIIEKDASRNSFDRNSCEKIPLSLGQRYFNIGSLTLNKSCAFCCMGLPIKDINGKDNKTLINFSPVMRPISSNLKLAYRGHVITCIKKVVMTYLRLLHLSLSIEEDDTGIGAGVAGGDDMDIERATFLLPMEGTLPLCMYSPTSRFA